MIITPRKQNPANTKQTPSMLIAFAKIGVKNPINEMVSHFKETAMA
jgi:hypothetical protein